MKKAKTDNILSRRCLEKIGAMKLTEHEQAVVETLLAEPIAYIPEDCFRRRTEMSRIMAEEVIPEPGRALSREEEERLFLQFNYSRYRLCQIRRKLLREPSWRQVSMDRLLRRYEEQLRLRSKIVTANMGLVLAMAQRSNYPGVDFTDLVSEGSMALLRAAEKFDCERGFRFSTYACRAIFKGFSRAAKQNYRYRNLFPAQLDTTLEKDDQIERQRAQEREYWVDEVREIMNDNLADLSGIELSVVKMRFSLGKEEEGPLTLKEVGARLGLTKERIRQIQNKALAKVREVAQERAAVV